VIDLNAHFNGDWEAYDHGTKAAVSGGTTFLVETETLETMPRMASEQSFCDIGFCKLISDSDLVSLPDSESILAYRAYL
jgi:hypothetical protein